MLPLLLGFLMVAGAFKDTVHARTLTDKDRNEIRARVEGFRSAQFGMAEKEVLRAIFRDFTIPKSQIERRIHPTEKTVSFNFQVNNLLPKSGPANLFYIFGYKSRRLMQVNVFWGRQATNQPDPKEVVDTANHLRDHFLNQGFLRKGMQVNAQLPDGSVLVFRGFDEEGRAVVLHLQNPEVKDQPSHRNISLRLSYIENPDSPDIFRIKNEDF